MQSSPKGTMASTQDQIKHLAEEEDDASTYAHAAQIIGAHAVPMTLKAVIELGVIEIIGGAGAGAQLSPAQIASQIPYTGNPGQDAVLQLDRMLRYLASHSVLTCSVAEGGDGGVERRYGLAPVCKYFTDGKDGNSLVPLLMMHQGMGFHAGWQDLKSVVLEGATPFTKANGMTIFEYVGKDPKVNQLFNQAMSGLSTFSLKKILEIYTGFEGLKELLDVGGGTGTSLHMIVSKYPHIKGINFDQPHVISDAPPLSGVEHVAGDMFVSVPSAEAFFMKWVLHSWSDERCVKILKNCHDVLPDSGKVIIVERIVPEAPETDAATRIKLYADVCMLTACVGGKERTKREFELLATQAGFSRFSVAASAYDDSLMELLK